VNISIKYKWVTSNDLGILIWEKGFLSTPYFVEAYISGLSIPS
jgi:hypothetical protein